MLSKILIANRGEIARRIIRTARRMGIATVAVYSDADAGALHVTEADEAVHIGPSPATESYLRGDRIIAAAKATGADGIHPGYGFLAENADFAEAVGKAGLKFIGPSPAAMRALGGKAAAKEVAINAGVPVVPGYQGEKQDAASLAAEARKIGYPVMIKAVAGGGGRGMRLVSSEAELPELLASAQREAEGAFGDARVLIERQVERPRHIELQVFGDAHGNVVHMFERDCTLQRRNQKVIEEAPAPGMSAALREKMCGAAVKLAKAVGYEGAGTVEFLVEGGTSSVAPSVAHQQPALGPEAKWYFIEMNTRLQVEHPVTEEITGLDLVEWQLRVASGEKLPLAQPEIRMSGHAIEARLCAEDPAKGFLPSIGDILWFEEPSRVRVEAGIGPRGTVSPFYDSMIAKVIATGADREQAIDRLIAGLSDTVLIGLRTNARFLRSLMGHPDTRRATFDTGTIGRNLDALCTEPRSPVATANAISYLARMARHMSSRQIGNDAEGPWSAGDGFALAENRQQTLDIVIDGKPERVSLAWIPGEPGPAVTIGGHAVSGATIERDRGRTLIQGDDRRCFALADLVHFEVARPTYDAASADDGHAGDHIRAPINGKVARVFVTEGQAVAKGDRIAVVEAMKMEHVLHAARDGTIAKVAASEGLQVNQGALIASLAEA
jgi:3-methylcrotonyl-CoA carboxylase alpha subunit